MMGRFAMRIAIGVVGGILLAFAPALPLFAAESGATSTAAPTGARTPDAAVDFSETGVVWVVDGSTGAPTLSRAPGERVVWSADYPDALGGVLLGAAARARPRPE